MHGDILVLAGRCVVGDGFGCGCVVDARIVVGDGFGDGCVVCDVVLGGGNAVAGDAGADGSVIAGCLIVRFSCKSFSRETLSSFLDFF